MGCPYLYQRFARTHGPLNSTPYEIVKKFIFRIFSKSYGLIFLKSWKINTSPRDVYAEPRSVFPDALISQHLCWFWEKIRNEADLHADSKILLILPLLFRKNTKNSVVRYNMIKICLLKDKLIPNENNADSRKSIHHNVTTDHNATTQNQKKTCLPEDI